MDKLFTSIQQSIHKGYVKTVEKVTPTLSTSKYLDEGVLTPDEVCAFGERCGLQLTCTCSLLLQVTCLLSNVLHGLGTIFRFFFIVFFDYVKVFCFVNLLIREAGDANRAVNYLPKEKQFLLTRNGMFIVKLLVC